MSLVIACFANLTCRFVLSLVGALRAQKIKTATYLHVSETTPLHRSVGHPYLAPSFEHAHDRVLTCSRHLAGDLHAPGMPGDRIMPVQTAASFSAPSEVGDLMRRVRAQPWVARRLNARYIGRVDRQNGVARLLHVAETLVLRDMPVDLRVVGSGLMEQAENGAEPFSRLGVQTQPPVIPECHQPGCIPIAAEFGAVSELLSPGGDGFLVHSGNDLDTAAARVRALQKLFSDDELRKELAAGCFRRSESNTWKNNCRRLVHDEAAYIADEEAFA